MGRTLWIIIVYRGNGGRGFDNTAGMGTEIAVYCGNGKALLEKNNSRAPRLLLAALKYLLFSKIVPFMNASDSASCHLDVRYVRQQ